MHMEQTLQKMRQLRLSAMAQSLESRLERGEHRNTDPEAFITRLIDDETEARASKRIKSLIQKAQLRPEQACLENIRHNSARGFTKTDLERFYRPDWIERAENMVFTGATGTGKTYLAEGLAFQACRMGYSSRKLSQNKLVEEIRCHRAMGQYGKFLKSMEQTKVLVIDDFLIDQHGAAQYCEILHVLEERVGRCVSIVTSQYPTDKWFERIPDPTLADAICDRLLTSSWVVQMKGPSQRHESK